MRLYLWRVVDALGRYETGSACAVAADQEAAIELVVSRAGLIEPWRSDLARELRATAPEVLEPPCGFIRWGGRD